MSTDDNQHPATPPRVDQDPETTGPDAWFSAAAEAANCARVLGVRRHGLDALLPRESATTPTP